MTRNLVLAAVACVLVLAGCAPTTLIRNTANTECERRVHSDRERCLRNNKSSDDALAARQGAGRDPKDSWAAQALKGMEAEAGK